MTYELELENGLNPRDHQKTIQNQIDAICNTLTTKKIVVEKYDAEKFSQLSQNFDQIFIRIGSFLPFLTKFLDKRRKV